MALFKFKTLNGMGWGTLNQWSWNLLEAINYSWWSSLSSKRIQPTVKGKQALQPFLLAVQWLPAVNSVELSGQFPRTYHLHLLLSKKPQPGPGTELDVPKSLRTFRWTVAGMTRNVKSLCSWGFELLSCKFNGPDRDQMSQRTIQTFSWGLKPNLCSQTILNVLITG